MRASHMRRGNENRQYQSGLDIVQQNIRKLNRGNLAALINSIHALNPSVYDKVIPMIARVIPITTDNETLLGFGYLIDCLIGMPAIMPFLQNQLVNLYCGIFRSLVNQKYYTGVNELKVMRKYWLGRIHPNSYAQMRIMIYEQMRIDIDYVPENLINDIYNHYLHFLRMDHKNIIVHLPQLNQNGFNQSQETQINHNHQNRKQLLKVNRAQKVQVQQNKVGVQSIKDIKEIKSSQLRESQINAKDNGLMGSYEKRQVLERITVLNIEPTKNIENNQTQQLQKQFQDNMNIQSIAKIKQQQNKINNLKRIRNDSEQTTISIKLNKKWRGENTSIQIPQNYSRISEPYTQKNEPKKMINYEAPQKQYKNDPISGFSVLFCEQCHICGLKILSKRLLDEHISRHKNHENPDPPINLQNSVVITFDNFMKYPDSCSHCNKGFNPYFYDGNWIFRNCMIRIIYEIQYVMHPQCSLLVEGEEVYPQVYIEGSQAQQEKIEESKDETYLKDEKDTSLQKSTIQEAPFQNQLHQNMISIHL